MVNFLCSLSCFRNTVKHDQFLSSSRNVPFTSKNRGRLCVWFLLYVSFDHSSSDHFKFCFQGEPDENENEELVIIKN